MDLMLAPLGGEARPLEEWLTTFHLATVVLDPYTNESSWILPTATRILEGLRGSDARVNFLVTADDRRRQGVPRPARRAVPRVHRSRPAGGEGARPDAAAGVRVRPVDGTVPAAAEGWSAAAWRAVAEAVAEATAWRTPDIPVVGDPGPFHGSPALG